MSKHTIILQELKLCGFTAGTKELMEKKEAQDNLCSSGITLCDRFGISC